MEGSTGSPVSIYGRRKSTHNQAKSYCLWAQYDFFMVTDSHIVQTFHIARGRLGELAPLFSCERNELPDRFGDLSFIRGFRRRR